MTRHDSDAYHIVVKLYVGVMVCCISVYLGDPKALSFSTVKNKQTLK